MAVAIEEKVDPVSSDHESNNSTSVVKPPTFPRTLDNFLKDIRAISRAYPLTTQAMKVAWKDAAQGFTHLIAKYGDPNELKRMIGLAVSSTVSEPSEVAKPLTVSEPSAIAEPAVTEKIEVTIKIPSGEERSFLAKIGDFRDMTSASTLVRRSFVFTLVSQYDAFLGNLIRTVFNIRPEILNSSEKSLTFSQLKSFPSIEEAARHIVDKEVESVLRESHALHFEWLERKLNLNLKNNLNVWPTFIELTERRNIFAHGNGLVSEQYISVCKNHHVSLPSKVRVGIRLDVSDEYFESSYECLYELGFKLTHVLWRALEDGDRAKADDDINARTLELISEGRVTLAVKLLEFFLYGMKKQFSSERVRLVALVNLAQAHKWAGNQPLCLNVLGQQDWSASAPDFLLAVSVLKNDFTTAAKHMKECGIKGSISSDGYTHWPVFREFRSSPEFLATYVEIFGEPFRPKEIQMTLEPETARQIESATSEPLSSNQDLAKNLLGETFFSPSFEAPAVDDAAKAEQKSP